MTQEDWTEVITIKLYKNNFQTYFTFLVILYLLRFLRKSYDFLLPQKSNNKVPGANAYCWNKALDLTFLRHFGQNQTPRLSKMS